MKYEFELQERDHGNCIAERIRTGMLPFFGEHLARPNDSVGAKMIAA